MPRGCGVSEATKDAIWLLRAVGLMDSLRHRKHFVDDLDVAIEHARSHVRRDGLVWGDR